MTLVNTTIKELYIVFDDDGKMTGASATPLITTTYPDGTIKKEPGAQIPLRTFDGEVVNTGLPEDRIGSLAKVVKALNIQATVRLAKVQDDNDAIAASLEEVRAELGDTKAVLASTTAINEQLRAVILEAATARAEPPKEAGPVREAPAPAATGETGAADASSPASEAAEGETATG